MTCFTWFEVSRIPNRIPNFHECFKVIVVLVSSTACQIPTFCKHFTSCTFLCKEKFADSESFCYDTKGQLISELLFYALNFPKNNEKI